MFLALVYLGAKKSIESTRPGETRMAGQIHIFNLIGTDQFFLAPLEVRAGLPAISAWDGPPAWTAARLIPACPIPDALCSSASRSSPLPMHLALLLLKGPASGKGASGCAVPAQGRLPSWLLCALAQMDGLLSGLAADYQVLTIFPFCWFCPDGRPWAIKRRGLPRYRDVALHHARPLSPASTMALSIRIAGQRRPIGLLKPALPPSKPSTQPLPDVRMPWRLPRLSQGIQPRQMLRNSSHGSGHPGSAQELHRCAQHH